VRPDARWSLGVGLALAVMSVSGACAEARSINLDECSETCVAPATNDSATDEDDAGASIILSRFGRGADDPNFALIFDRKAMPAALADGLPSALASASAEVPAALGVSPYDFFADIIDVPHSADAREFAAASFFLLTPSLTSQLVWASNDFFGPSGDIASRRAVPIRADADALYGDLYRGLYGGPRMQTRVTPTLGFSPLSGPPSSGAAKPFGQVWDEAGRSLGFSSDGAGSNK
jgi:hypothetical protein